MRFDDYLQRIGQRPPADASLDTLRRLHLAHRETFLFENVSIQTGGAIRLGLEDLERKFLDEGRGGYCFEHNTLFAAALAGRLLLLGRVRGPPERWSRTHGAARACRPRGLVVDVGFGSMGLIEPIPCATAQRPSRAGSPIAFVATQLDSLSTRRRRKPISGLCDPRPRWTSVANHYTSAPIVFARP